MPTTPIPLRTPPPGSGVGACPRCSQPAAHSPLLPPAPPPPTPEPPRRAETALQARRQSPGVRRPRCSAALRPSLRAHPFVRARQRRRPGRVRPHAHAEANHSALSWAVPARTRAGPRDRACERPVGASPPRRSASIFVLGRRSGRAGASRSKLQGVGGALGRYVIDEAPKN